MKRSTLLTQSAFVFGFAFVSFAAAAATPTPFTATYRVSSGDQPQGTAIIKLTAQGDGTYNYSTRISATEGLAAALGASSVETTIFQWRDNAPATLSYTADIHAFKTKHRQMTVDPASHQVSVDEGKGSQSYTAVPGMVDRNSVVLAIGLALAAGQKNISLPVGVRQQVEQQQYTLSDQVPVQVPAGHFNAQQVQRSDSSKPFSAWYVAQKYPVPVKITQGDGSNLTLELQSFTQP